MKLRINASTPAVRRYLEVDEAGVVYCDAPTTSLTGITRIDYADIVAVLRDAAQLSIQVGDAIYRVPYQPNNREHTQAVAMLVEACRRTLQ